MRSPTVTPKYKRILLKLSGEALMGDDPYGINRQTIQDIVGEIATVVRMGVEIGAVIGGGRDREINLFGARVDQPVCP